MSVVACQEAASVTPAVWVAAIGAVTAAVTAVALHLARLGHERRMADLAVIRETLTRGLGLVRTLNETLEGLAKARHEVQQDERPALTREAPEAVRFEAASRAWRGYMDEIELLFDDDHPVNRASWPLRKNVPVWASISSLDDEASWAKVHDDFVGLYAAWRVQARKHGRAEMQRRWRRRKS